MNVLKKIGVATAFAISVLGFTGCDTSSILTANVQYSNPSWAPPYYAGARYYYLPDIETYYDLSDQEFAYLDNGQWMFSPSLPPIYSGYDLYNGFVICLNLNVYQPWMHHQYYVSHYPRYYYHNTYRDQDISTIRGFNEREGKPIFWRQEDRSRINDMRKNENTPKRVEPQRVPQQPNYYGKDIGKPVKVRPQMRDKGQKNNDNGKRNNNNNNNNNNNGKENRKDGRPQ